MSAAASYSTASVLLDNIIVNRDLMSRPMRTPNVQGERAALRALTEVMAEGCVTVLKRLATLAIQLCSAGSAGVSVLEDDENGEPLFRWRALAGRVERYEGGTTPRHFSPCGSCLAAGKAILYSYPARHYTYFQELEEVIVEGLVIPMYLDGVAVGTIWIISHDEQSRFDAEDVRVMTTLGSFAAAALRPPAPQPSLARARVDRDGVWSEYIGQIAQGDDCALAALFRETHPLVFTTALRILGFREDAEEVAADVYSRVWRAAQTYDRQRGTVIAWLIAIARNLAYDRLRVVPFRMRAETPLPVHCSSGVSPEIHAAAVQTRDQLQTVLQTLPVTQREVLERAYFSDLSHGEIAEQLSIPLGTVKTRIRMGLVTLRRLLAAGS